MRWFQMLVVLPNLTSFTDSQVTKPPLISRTQTLVYIELYARNSYLTFKGNLNAELHLNTNFFMRFWTYL